MLLYVHRDHKDYKGRGAQDGHLDFHTQFLSYETFLMSTETIRTISYLLAGGGREGGGRKEGKGWGGGWGEGGNALPMHRRVLLPL